MGARVIAAVRRSMRSCDITPHCRPAPSPRTLDGLEIDEYVHRASPNGRASLSRTKAPQI
jgi:hypothetical protein